MRHLTSMKKMRDTLINARRALVEELAKDRNGPFYWPDYSVPILNEIDDAIAECDTYAIGGK